MNLSRYDERKESSKMIGKSSRTNTARLETLPCYQNKTQELHSPPLPRKNKTDPLYQGENSQSSYLKRVKIGSFRGKNQTYCSTNKKPNPRPWAEDAPIFFQKVPEQDKPSPQTKGRSAKSFMIRKKNNSNYCKKQQDENKCELQNLHKLVMEAYEHSKELDQKGYGEQSLNFQSEKNNFKHKPKSVYTQQNNSNQEWLPLKVKPVICKQPKKTARVFCDTTSSKINELRPSIQKKALDSSKPIDQMLKKVKNVNISRQQMRNSKDSNLQTQKTNESHHKQQQSRPTHNKQNKRKTYTGCKTIRVPWQSSTNYYNDQKESKQTKQTSKLICPTGNDKEEEWPFGQISMIPHQPKVEERCASRKNSIPIQSLQELYIELQKAAEDTHNQSNCIEDPFI